MISVDCSSTWRKYSAHVGNCKLNPKYELKRERSREQQLSKPTAKKKRNVICSKCEKEFILLVSDLQFNKNNYSKFCSVKCANSRIWTNEDNNKKAQALNKLHTTKRGAELRRLSSERAKEMWKGKIVGDIDNVISEITISHRQHISELWKNKLMSADYSTLKFERLRQRIIYEQNEQCNKCKNSEWLGVPMVFELDHIDGDNTNNQRENLEALCPNCHSQTDTWRGKNKKCNNFKTKISDDILIEALIKNDMNIRQALISVNLAAKGGNYNRCHKLIRFINK